MSFAYKFIKSPVGELKLIAKDDKLAAILWENDDPSRIPMPEMEEDAGRPVLVETARQLEEYFAGQRSQFDVPTNFQGTEFQRKVWNALLRIPFGETRSYAQIAKLVGSEKAFRAVGAANGRNPISIIAACHRVIGASGKLVGFAGGLETKKFLLDLEAARAKAIVSGEAPEQA